jgi:hypothetical protein
VHNKAVTTRMPAVKRHISPEKPTAAELLLPVMGWASNVFCSCALPHATDVADGASQK